MHTPKKSKQKKGCASCTLDDSMSSSVSHSRDEEHKQLAASILCTGKHPGFVCSPLSRVSPKLSAAHNGR